MDTVVVPLYHWWYSHILSLVEVLICLSACGLEIMYHYWLEISKNVKVDEPHYLCLKSFFPSILLVTLQVADRGYYELKPEYWKEFDPLFAHYYLNEMEEAEVSEFCAILGQHTLLYISLCVLTLSTLICAIRLPS